MSFLIVLNIEGTKVRYRPSKNNFRNYREVQMRDTQNFKKGTPNDCTHDNGAVTHVRYPFPPGRVTLCTKIYHPMVAFQPLLNWPSKRQEGRVQV